MIPRRFPSAHGRSHRFAAPLAAILFIHAHVAAQSPESPLVLQHGQNSTDFGQANSGKTGPVDWVKDEKTGTIRVMLEKNGHYTDGTFLGRGPDGSDYFTFEAKYYRLAVPRRAAPSHSNHSGMLGSLGRVAGGSLGAAAGTAAGAAASHHSTPQANADFTEIPASEVPPPNFLSLGRSPQHAPASQGVPVLTEFKDAKGVIIARTLQLPNQASAMMVNPAPCFGADAYVNASSPTMIYILARDAARGISGFRQISNDSGNDPCSARASVQASAASPAAAAPSDPAKPNYVLKQMDGDQYRLIYTDKNGRQDILVTKLKENLFCSTTLAKTYIIEPDTGLSVLASDQAMAIKCTMKSAEQYQQPQR